MYAGAGIWANNNNIKNPVDQHSWKFALTVL